MESNKVKAVMKQLLSIIVPIYNAEQYLIQCIESIINQTYDNLQIIFVDDGSTDSSLEICNFYAQKDKRIVIVQKENGGVVSARKAGVKAANGKMIGFVDADDWIEPDYFENMMAIFMETNADIVAGGHFHDIGESSVKVLNHVSVGLHETRAILDQLIYSGEFYEYGITPQLYTKIIRSDILKATQESVDERIQCGEDAAVTYPSVLKAKRLYVTDFCGYHYVQHQGSMTKTENREESVLIQVLIKFLEESIGNLVSDIVLRDGLREQLRIYNNYMLSLREIGIFDKKLLLPFGGISYGSKVVIYGAGVLGQKIYQYLLKSKQIEIVEWVDQNFSYYREKGLDVNEPGRISLLKYDHILIANISHRVFVKIKKYLIEELNVEDEKIRWFSDDFVN